MKRWLRDWWRGYSDADYASMLEKLASPAMRQPGEIIRITVSEMRAYHDMHRRLYR